MKKGRLKFFSHGFLAHENTMDAQVHQIQNKLINNVLSVQFVFAIFALIASLFRAFQMGWQPVFGVHLFSAILSLSLFLFRYKLGFVLKSHLASSLCLFIGLAGAFFYGVSGGFFFCILSVIVSALIFGKRMGMLYAFLSIFFIALIAILQIFKVIQLNTDFNVYNRNFSTWLTLISGLFYILMITVYSIGLYYELFRNNIISRLKNEEQLQLQNKEYLALNNRLSAINAELLYAKVRAEESDRLKTAFLQNMSHEIRTPMNAIMGFASLMPRNLDNKTKLEQFARIISQRSSDLLDIINDILDISKIESGQLTVYMEPCDINELFADLTLLFAEHQKRMGKAHLYFRLKNHCEPSLVTINTDVGKLRQILVNLINNALKFTENGGVEGGCRFGEDGELLFYVSDTGIGIPSDKLEAVFERFIQLEHGAKMNIGGTGLGLPIVRGLVNLLGGDIHLESELHKGSTFSFSISY